MRSHDWRKVRDGCKELGLKLLECKRCGSRVAVGLGAPPVEAQLSQKGEADCDRNLLNGVLKT